MQPANKIIHAVLTVAVFSLSEIAVAAGPWTWATETAMSRFTPEDVQLLAEAGQNALDNLTDDESVSWENPQSGHRGDITVSNTRDIDGITCRDVLLDNDARSIKGTAEYVLCRQADDTWKITFIE